MPQTLRLFAANGDAVAESPGTLWDLLANMGAAAADIDVAAMTVAIIDEPSKQIQRVQPLGPALATVMDEQERARTVDALEARASGYQRLATWLREIAPPDEPIEEPVEEPVEEPMPEAQEPISEPSDELIEPEAGAQVEHEAKLGDEPVGDAEIDADSDHQVTQG